MSRVPGARAGHARAALTSSEKKTFVKSIIREVAGFSPYEKRVMELLRNSKDKKARKLTKKRVSGVRQLFPLPGPASPPFSLQIAMAHADTDDSSVLSSDPRGSSRSSPTSSRSSVVRQVSTSLFLHDCVTGSGRLGGADADWLVVGYDAGRLACGVMALCTFCAPKRCFCTKSTTSSWRAGKCTHDIGIRVTTSPLSYTLPDILSPPPIISLPLVFDPLYISRFI